MRHAEEIEAGGAAEVFGSMKAKLPLRAGDICVSTQNLNFGGNGVTFNPPLQRALKLTF